MTLPKPFYELSVNKLVFFKTVLAPLRERKKKRKNQRKKRIKERENTPHSPRKEPKEINQNARARSARIFGNFLPPKMGVTCGKLCGKLFEIGEN